MRRSFLVIPAQLGVACLLLGGSVSAQNIVGFQAAPAVEHAATTTTHYEKVAFYDCYGRLCHHYKPVVVAAPAAKVVEPVTVTNPIGQQNTDNSVTYKYTYNITYGQLPAEQGSTVYGYPSSVFESADVYGNIDLGAQLNNLNRLAAQMGSDASSVANGLKDTVDKLGANQARIAEIQANKQALVASILATAEQTRANADLAKALRAENSAHFERRVEVIQGDRVQKVTPDNGQPDPVAPPPEVAGVQVVFNRACVSCHGAGSKKGGLDLSDLSKVSAAQADKIADRITTADASRRMPPVQEGHDVNALTPAEIKAILKAMH